MGLAFVFGATVADAQTPTHSFADLQRVLKPGQALVITDRTGQAAVGRFVAIDGDQLEIAAGRSRLTFAEDAVRQIRHMDRTWDGGLIGSAAGALLGWAIAKGCRSEPASCEEGYEAALALFPLGGWFAGEWVDGQFHKSLYVAPRSSPITLAPLVGRSRIGITASISMPAGAR
jgi:uncharacterized membrane protein